MHTDTSKVPSFRYLKDLKRTRFATVGILYTLVSTMKGTWLFGFPLPASLQSVAWKLIICLSGVPWQDQAVDKPLIYVDFQV